MSLTAKEVKKISRYINANTARMIWGVSAGVCEFYGCTNRLYTHHVTKENVNLAENAHVYSFSEGGKRFSRLIPRERINDIDNLMLVCDSCHKLIDSTDTDYSAEELLSMKKEHEERVSLLVSIKPDLQSEVVIYNCNIGKRGICIKDYDAMKSITPEYYPARIKPINLSPDLKLYDNEPEFWHTMAKDLERQIAQYDSSIRDKHISLFAIAPQPLLFKLGTILNRNYDVAVKQAQGDIVSWRWQEDKKTIDLYLDESLHDSSNERVVITFEISARLSDVELATVFAGHNIYRIIANECAPTVIKSRDDLLKVTDMFREVLNKIRLESVPNVKVALLPIAPSSVAIETGRQLMNGDPIVTVYNRNYLTKVWVPTLSF